MKKNVAKKNNTTIYIMQKMLTYDSLMFYAISFYYYSQIKSFSALDIMTLTSVYALAKVVLQLPVTLLYEKIGYKKSIILGNIFFLFYSVFLIIGNGLVELIVANIFCAIGFGLKTIESNYLYEILKSENRESEYGKIESKSIAMYFYLEAILAILAGITYNINPYIPVICSTIIVAISLIISFQFQDIKLKKSEHVSTKRDYFKDLKYGFRDILKSRRLRALFLYAFAFAGILEVSSSYRSSLMYDLEVNTGILGILSSIYMIINGIASQNQDKLEKIFKRKSLTVMAITFTASFIFISIIAYFKFPGYLPIIIGIYGIQYAIRGPYPTWITKYLINFTNTITRNRIKVLYSIIESIGKMSFTFIAGLLLENTNPTTAFFIAGCAFTLIMTYIGEYMSTRLGLNPREYREEDVKFAEVK